MMNLDWIKVIEKYSKSALVSILVFFTLCTITVPFLWGRYDELSSKTLQLEKRQNALDIKETDLNRREQLIDEKSAKTDNDCASQAKEALEKLNKKENSLKAKEQILKDEENKINRLKAEYSEAAKKHNAEQKVIALMDKFSALGVDLHHEDWCDKDYTKRFYEGEAILNQIYSIVTSNNLGFSYTSFLQRHMSGIKKIRLSRECEKDGGPQP
jgi:hypothetical protein